MRKTACLMALGACLTAADPAKAGDYFFDCAQPGGGFIVEEGDKRLEIFYAKPGEPFQKDGDAIKYKLLKQTTVKQTEGYCEAPDGAKYNFNAHSYLYHIEIPTDGQQPTRVTFLCEVGGSGVPAGVQKCTDVITKDVRLQPAYKDFAKK